MNFRCKIVQLWVTIAVSIVFAQVVNASELEYQEVASEVIMNSLKSQPKRSFLRKLYAQLFFVPVWMQEKKLSTAAKDLFAQIKNDGTLDTNGILYQNALDFEKKAQAIYTPEGTTLQKIELEIKISQLYHAYTNYAYMGSINWGAFQARISNLMVNDVNTEWVLHRPKFKAIDIVENAALGGSLSKQLKNAIPKQYHYRELQKKLVEYRQIEQEGGWPHVLLQKTLKKGQTADGVIGLRKRLRITGDYIPCKQSIDNNNTYDTCLQKAVKHFQQRNGLAVDGDIGSGTLKALNITVKKRIGSILLNLDRIKWLKQQTAKRHIIINIPDFMLYFEEDGKLIQKIRTVVGRPNHPTPIFSNIVRRIVLNPYWNVPKSIVQKELIPKLLKNPKAMEKKGIEIRAGWGKHAKKVDASLVDWREYQYSKYVPFRFAQLPGKRNALGKLKFLFPNKYSVYMHDTPSKGLFSRSKRAYSHGCVRLQKPRELLKTFAKFNQNIDLQKSQEILKGKEKTSITLEERVPIDVIYLTSWVDYDGVLQFRNDVYGYDKMQLKSFRKW